MANGSTKAKAQLGSDRLPHPCFLSASMLCSIFFEVVGIDMASFGDQKEKASSAPYLSMCPTSDVLPLPAPLAMGHRVLRLPSRGIVCECRYAASKPGHRA